MKPNRIPGITTTLVLEIALVLAPSIRAQDDAAATEASLPGWMQSLAPADPSRVFVEGAGRGRKVTLEGWTRNGYPVSAERPLPLRFKVEPGEQLELGFALVAENPDASPPALDFLLCKTRDAPAASEGDADPDELPLFFRRVDADQAGRWWTHSVDLGAFAGEEISLTIRVEPVPRAAESESPPQGGFTAVAAEPVLLRTPRDPPWNVVLLSIDTLRADHLSCYGYPRRTSPHLDELAAQGVRFAWDVSAAPWTTPSHMSILTGLYPSGHHVNESFDQQTNNGNEGAVYRTLARDTPTLAERLRDAGWLTKALTSGVCVEAWLGFDHGFDSFHVGSFKLAPEVPAEVGAFLANSALHPFFLFLHTYEAHEPYTEIERGRKWLSTADSDAVAQLLLLHSPDEIANDPEILTRAGLARAEVLTAFYDAGVETADAYVGFLMRSLKELGLWDRTLLVVTSDHGQELADHDPGLVFGMHGHTLYDELLHVPLLMHVPDAVERGLVVAGLVQSVDVTPTILDLLGLEPTPGAQGVSLARLAREGGTSTRQQALSECTSSGQEWKSLRTRSHKLLAGFDLPTPERSGIPCDPAWQQLYDLLSDPGEKQDLLADPDQHPDLIRQFADLVERLHDRMFAGFASITRPIGDATPGKVPSEEMLERLRRLGYAR